MGVKSNTTVYKDIMKTCMKYQQTLSQVLSPLVSFMYHPDFQEAVSRSNFSRWEIMGLGKLGKLR